MNDVRWYQRVGVWLGTTINPASIALGAGLAGRVPLKTLAILIPVGVAVLTTLVVMAGINGRRRRLPLSGLASRTFGEVGAWAPNFLMALGMLGWADFQTGWAGSAGGGWKHRLC